MNGYGYEYTASMFGSYTHDENDLMEIAFDTIKRVGEVLDLRNVRVDLYMEEEGQGFNLTLDRKLTMSECDEVRSLLKSDLDDEKFSLDFDEDEATILLFCTWWVDVDIAY